MRVCVSICVMYTFVCEYVIVNSQYGMVWHGMAWYSIVHHNTAQHLYTKVALRMTYLIVVGGVLESCTVQVHPAPDTCHPLSHTSVS